MAIHAAKVLDQFGSGLESQVIAGIDWCVAQGAHIISMSLGSDAPSDGEDTLSVVANTAVANGSVVVVAAGKDSDSGAGLIDGYALVASAKGVSAYQPTAFPTYRRVSASVANHGLWTYTFAIAQADLGIPIGAAITINGQAKCILLFFGSCFAAQWDPDLDAKLIDPNGVLLADSNCLADDECGGIGRQETLHAMPTVAGTYTIQVSPSEDSVNLGKGGSFFVDISRGPLASVASNPLVHVGDLDASSTSVKSGWKATITITVHDANHGLVPNATVSGDWSGGYSGNSSCTTGVDGWCSVSGNISKRKTSANFTVTNITGALTYQPVSNHDPDPDSNGTLITVLKP